MTIEPIAQIVPGMHTLTLKASGHPTLPSIDAEYLSEHEGVLVQRAILAGYDFVSTTSWVHRWNNPGCKPDIVANVCGMTVWKREGVAPKEEGIDLWGPSY